MNSLRQLKNPIPRRAVAVSDEESFTVRGVGLDDIIVVYLRHTGEMSLAFEKLAGAYRDTGQVAPTDVATLLAGCIQEAPLLAAEIIAIASGADLNDLKDFGETTEIARSLSLAVQVVALEQIADLTFTS